MYKSWWRILLLHSRKLTWNLKMMVSNRNLLFQVSIFGCHVSFRECIAFCCRILSHGPLADGVYGKLLLDPRINSKTWISQWLFLVPLKGGRDYIIPQLAVYTTYIPLIYCLLGGLYATYHLLGEPEATIEYLHPTRNTGINFPLYTPLVVF